MEDIIMNLEPIIVAVLAALTSLIVGFVAGLVARGRKSILDSENKIDDAILKIIDEAIARSKGQ